MPVTRRALRLAVALTALLAPWAAAQADEPSRHALAALPSEMPLLDYEREVLYPWLFNRDYARLGWAVDPHVRDTGPFIQSQNFGTHTAVRIHYSPEMVAWLRSGREGGLPDGAVIVKEMFQSPAAFYEEVRRLPYFRDHPEAFETMLAGQLLTGWAVMIKDSGGDSADGWFWSAPGSKPTLDQMLEPVNQNVDDYSHVLTSGFGIGTCIRCHASAESENTFASSANFVPGGRPLQFRVDNSWRSADRLAAMLKVVRATLASGGVPDRQIGQWLAPMALPDGQRPWAGGEALPAALKHEKAMDHTPDPAAAGGQAKGASSDVRPANAAFVAAFSHLEDLAGRPFTKSDLDRFSFPFEYADHVYPGPAAAKGGTLNPDQYVTSDNCYGCHGGLGGAPYPVSMFVQKGPAPGDGYNISPYGEWRWSPMGLAGRDPIFHAQLESELILLMKENGQLEGGKPASGAVGATQQALVDTCLRCHGAMGLRQSGIDKGGDTLNPHFDPNLFFVAQALTEEEIRSPPFVPLKNAPHPPARLDAADLQGAWRLGALAREGISCTVCHHIAPPDPAVAKEWADGIRGTHPDWIGTATDVVWSDAFFYFLGVNNTGLYERGPANALYGPFADVKDKPMLNAMGVAPELAPSMDDPQLPFVSDSAMCGTCHTINLPIIGAARDEHPVLTALEPNEHFKALPHSIEQATYLEWLNSSFGLGKDNTRDGKPMFQSCQDCHMPNRFGARGDASAEIAPLASQIASIQDATYPQSEHQLPAEDLLVKTRADYRRHELVGLNAFLIEMFRQFPAILGVDGADYETGASTGASFAIDNMLLAAEEGRVATVELGGAAEDGRGNLVVDVVVTNKTGHRFPSGVAFRRAWVELLVLGADGKVLWGSGQTNAVGLIIDTAGEPLLTEFLDRKKTPGNQLAQYQPNHQVISSDRQVQIYEELTTDKDHQFSTSFVHRVHHIKDNRLLPHGWVTPEAFAGLTAEAGIGPQGALLLEFMEATGAEGESVLADKDFTASPSDGADRLRYAIPIGALDGTPASVQATVYSQSFMPAWFQERFALGHDARAAGYSTPAIDRLFYIASRLQLVGTPLEGWKIKVATTGAQPVRR